MNQRSPENLKDPHSQSAKRLFVPFSEDLLAAAGSPLGELVPFQLEYRCVRLLDGTYEFSNVGHPVGTAAA